MKTVLHPSGGDDTAAIQKAIDKTREVVLVSGTFRVSAPIQLPAGAFVTGKGKD